MLFQLKLPIAEISNWFGSGTTLTWMRLDRQIYLLVLSSLR